MFTRIATSLLLASTLAAASNVTFFLSMINDTCSMDGVTLNAPENTAHGALCAYDSDSKKIWACPAPDSMCWGDAEDCHGTNSTTPASNQLGCHNGFPITWCCDLQAENCTETSDQINICWAKGVVNPNAGVPPAAASSIAASSLAAISSAAIASRLSALATTTPMSSALATTTSASALITATTRQSATSASATSTSSSSGSGSLSGGAIAGAVIGAVVGVVLIALAAFFVHRRRMGKIRAGEPPKLHSEPFQEYKNQQQGYYDPPMERHEAPATHYVAPVEMGVEQIVHELPSHNAPK